MVTLLLGHPVHVIYIVHITSLLHTYILCRFPQSTASLQISNKRNFVEVFTLFKILRINKFLEISPSTAFQARAVTGRLLCLLRCLISRWTLYCFSACAVTLQSPIDNFVVSDYYLKGQKVYLFTSMYVSPARTYTYKSYVSCTPG